MEILEDWGDVVPHFSVSEETGCCILGQLLMEVVEMPARSELQ